VCQTLVTLKPKIVTEKVPKEVCEDHSLKVSIFEFENLWRETNLASQFSWIYLCCVVAYPLLLLAFPPTRHMTRPDV
jgi:hypothetical protein